MVKKQQDFKEKIIKVALDIFEKFGFRKTTMDDIARALNKTKGALYYYYKSKNEIFIDVAEKEVIYIINEIKRAILEEDSAQKKIYAYCMARIKVARRLANIIKIINQDYIASNVLVEKIKEKFYKAEHRIIKSILKLGVETNVFVIKNLDSTTNNIITFLNGVEYSNAEDSNTADIEIEINNLLDIFFYGVVKR